MRQVYRSIETRREKEGRKQGKRRENENERGKMEEKQIGCQIA